MCRFSTLKGIVANPKFTFHPECPCKAYRLGRRAKISSLAKGRCLTVTSKAYLHGR